MKKIFLILIITFSIVFHGFSQPWKSARFEVYGGVNMLQYFGDIGGSADKSNLFGLKDINILKIRPGVSGGVRYHLSKPLQIKANFLTGFLTQSDEGSRNEGRNFSFFTYINELSVVAEYYILPESDQNYYYSIMQVRGGLRHYKRPISLYVFAGAGGLVYFTNPGETLEGSSRYEGEKNVTMVIPAGIGIKFAMLPKLNLGIELGGRFSFSDYLDGYTSPYSKFNDVYYSLAVVANYKIRKKHNTEIGVKRRKFLF